MTIAVFIPCYVDQFSPHIGRTVVEVLERLGHTVEYPPGQTCCGQPAFNAGYINDAQRVADHFLAVFEHAEHVVVPSGSCASMVKCFYRTLYERDASARARVEQVASRTHEFSSFLVDELGITDVGARFPHRVTVHDGCHGLRELGIRTQPRTLLSHVKDLTLVEMSEAQRCCGFGGSFSIKFPAISTAMAEVKAASVIEADVEYVISNDPSCMLQLQGYFEKNGLPMQCKHLAEVLVAR